MSKRGGEKKNKRLTVKRAGTERLYRVFGLVQNELNKLLKTSRVRERERER